MVFPLVLVTLGIVSWFPEVALGIGDHWLSFLLPRRELAVAVSWLGGHRTIGLLCLAVGALLIARRFNRRPAKKLL